MEQRQGATYYTVDKESGDTRECHMPARTAPYGGEMHLLSRDGFVSMTKFAKWKADAERAREKERRREERRDAVVLLLIGMVLGATMVLALMAAAGRLS